MRRPCCADRKSLEPDSSGQTLTRLGSRSVASFAFGLLPPKCPAYIPLYLAIVGVAGLGMESGEQILFWARTSSFAATCIFLGLAVSVCLRKRSVGKVERPPRSPS